MHLFPPKISKKPISPPDLQCSLYHHSLISSPIKEIPPKFSFSILLYVSLYFFKKERESEPHYTERARLRRSHWVGLVRATATGIRDGVQGSSWEPRIKWLRRKCPSFIHYDNGLPLFVSSFYLHNSCVQLFFSFTLHLFTISSFFIYDSTRLSAPLLSILV